MATHQIFLSLKSCFSFADERILSESLCRKMFRHGHFLWVSLCNFMLNILWLIVRCLERGKADHKLQKIGSTSNFNDSQEDGKLDSKSSMNSDSDFAAEKENSNLSFGLLSQESKDFKEKVAETEDSAFMQSGFSASTLKYQFMAGHNVRGFMEEPETMSFAIQEMFVDSMDGLISDDDQIIDNTVPQNEDEVQEFDRCSNASSTGDGFFRDLQFCNSDYTDESHMEEGPIEQERSDYPFKNPFSEEIVENKEPANSAHNKVVTEEVMDDDISYEVQLLPRIEFSDSEFSPELETPGEKLFTSNHEPSFEAKPEIIERSLSEKEERNGKLCTDKGAEEDIEDEYIEFEPHPNDVNKVDETILSQKDEYLFEVAHTGGNETEGIDDGSQGSEDESLAKESWESESDDEDDEFDILLEHQQLVKQMKMEMKNSKVRVLPTISEDEECETPKITQDLKPIKLDEKFEYKDLMEEILKFYKSYAEKMRKLDILNYQTLHAISFLQLKDSQIFVPSKKSLISSINPFSLPNLKHRRIFADPNFKSITEMLRDLEYVYIGQVCLSWEILHWQYEKVIALLEHDSQDHRSYNQVAGEYQQFQVLVQRFLEDERFNGPRIQNYVNSRCFCCGLLQVPILKDDCPRDKKEVKEDSIDAISISMLAESIRESMQVFWEFLRADKVEANGVLKSVQGSLVDPHADSEFLINVRTSLDKKERKLKEIERIGNCIVKKFQKHQAGQPSNSLLISKVELKLVSRVLNLSRLTTDHLIWCQKKLDNINIVNRKIRVEPAFLLFSC